MAKKTYLEYSKLREAYLLKRQELLMAQVDTLSVKLFDRIFERYLSELEKANGKIVFNSANISMVAGLDKIYKTFREQDNAPVVKQFVVDMQSIPTINNEYFLGVQQKDTASALKLAKKATNTALGIDSRGKIIQDGFVDKFLRDETLLKRIKKQTNQAITQGKGFEQFKNELKIAIQGEDGKPLSGGVQQYYRNYAYDTYQKVDRLNSDVFAGELAMRYFFYSGGELPTSRELCVFCHGKIVNADEFKKLKYNQLKPVYQNGMSNGKDYPAWKPLIDLGGWGCIHRKDYIDEALAMQMKDQHLDIQMLKQ